MKLPHKRKMCFAPYTGNAMYIITGGAGFLGSALLWELNRQGRAGILVVDNLDHSEKWKNLVPRRYADYMHRDDFLRMVRSSSSLPWKLRGVVHLGACSDTTQRDADFLMTNNYHYSRELCRWAVAHGARYIQASSAATYGDGSLGFDDDPALLENLRPLNMYGYSKHLFDLWAQRDRILDRIVSLKFFNVYGPGEAHKGAMRSVISKAYEEITATGRLKLFRSTHADYADGGQMRDFVYVKDCVRAMFWLLEHPEVNGVFNMGTGVARSWNDLARAVFTAMGRPEAIDYVDMPEALRGKYQNYTCARMDRLLATGCPPCDTSLEEGVADYVRQYLATGALL